MVVDPEDDEDGKNDIVILVVHLPRHVDQHHGDLHEDLKRTVDQQRQQCSVDHDGGAWVMHDNNTPREDDDDDMDDEIEEEVDVDNMVIDVDGILLAEKMNVVVVQHDDDMTK